MGSVRVHHLRWLSVAKKRGRGVRWREGEIEREKTVGEVR